MWRVYGPALASLASTAIMVFFLRPLARTLDFIDRPGGRKIHSEDVPVTGGIAMFIGLALGVSLLPDSVRPPLGYLSIAFVFVLMGLLDDRFALSPSVRLVVQCFAAMVMATVIGLAAQHVGAPFGPGRIIFVPQVAVMLTVVLVVGAINSFNMVDGIDGLAGSLGLVALAAVGMVAIQSGDAGVFGIALTFGGAIIGFLLFNLPFGFNVSLRAFMGDAGSMLIGFTLAWCLLALSQRVETAVAPITLIWFVAIPIFDLVSTAMGRVLRGHSPFHADTSHFHHALMARGVSRPRVLVILVGLAVLWAVVGATLEILLRFSETVSLLGFVSAGIVSHIGIRRPNITAPFRV